MTLKEVSELYNVIKVLKFNGVPADLRLRIIKLMRRLKPHAERLQGDIRDAVERFKSDNFDADQQTLAELTGKPLTPEQQRMYVIHRSEEQQLNKSVNDFLLGVFKDGKREGGVYAETVGVKIGIYSESDINRILVANEDLDTESCVVLLDLIGE